MSRPSSGAPRVLAALSVAVLLSSCRYFPRHEDVYVPIPLRIGEMRVDGADTSYVLQGPGYEAVAFAREVLLEARPELDGAGVSFRRYFGAEPQVVRIHYDAVEDRSFRQPRTGGGDPPPQPTGRRGSGEIRVNVGRPRNRGEPVRVPPVSLPLAREWVMAFERTAGGAESAAAAGLPRDSAGRALPDWFRTGAADLVARSSRQTLYLAMLRRQLGDAPALEDFFRAPSPEPADTSEVRPRRSAPQSGTAQRLDRVGIWRAQSVAVVRYLAEREGPEFIGMVAERLLRGEDILDIALGTRSLAGTPAALDEAWRAWLEAVAQPLRGD